MTPSGSVKYDDWGWHTGGVFPADQPQINGYTHIGMYLVWLFKHDLHNPDLLGQELTSRVRSGRRSAHDLADETDGKLTSDAMSAEGRAFSDWYYSTGDPLYLRDWAAAFSDQPEYTVGDSPATYARIERVIDRRFREWVRSGRPAAPPARERSVAARRGPRDPELVWWLVFVVGLGLVLGAGYVDPPWIKGGIIAVGICLFLVSLMPLYRLGALSGKKAKSGTSRAPMDSDAGPPSGIRKQVGDLTLADLDACAIWEFAQDELDVDGRDEETVRPRPDWQVADPANGLAIARATFTAKDGTTYRGYYYVASEPGLGSLQPTIITDTGHVNFWLGMFPPPQAVLDGYLVKLGTTPDDLFPLSFKGDLPAKRHKPSGVIPSFRKSSPGDPDGAAA